MDCQAFWLSKRHNLPDEYEDSFDFDLQAGRFAVADGASESIFASAWAQMLVQQFVATSEESALSWDLWLPPLQESWAESYRGRELPWYAERKLQQGAFATFLGLNVTPSDNDGFAWQAIAVGDTCLCHTRGAELLSVFPFSRSDQFNNRPQLVGSRTPVEIIVQERAVSTQGDAVSGDRIWMMTDALAHWFLCEYEAAGQPWTQCESLLTTPDNQEHFAAWIEELRDSKRLHNDDVTLLGVSL